MGSNVDQLKFMISRICGEGLNLRGRENRGAVNGERETGNFGKYGLGANNHIFNNRITIQVIKILKMKMDPLGPWNLVIIFVIFIDVVF